MATLELRPLSLGELLDRTFFLYRRHFLLFIGIAAIPYLVVVVAFLVPGLLLYVIPARGPMTPPARAVMGTAGGIFLLALGFLALVAFLYSAGASVFAVSEIYAGRRPTIRGSYGLVRGKAATIFGIMILSGLIVIAGIIALIIPGLYLICRIPVATAAAMIEDLGPIDSIRKSFDLTRGFARRSALIYLLVIGLTYGVGLTFQLPFLALAAAAPRHSHLLILWTVLGQVGNLLGGILVGAVPTIAFALLYYDLRIRKEAFDLQTMMQAIGPDPTPPAITGGVPSMFGRDAS
jgi:hypothetical protein